MTIALDAYLSDISLPRLSDLHRTSFKPIDTASASMVDMIRAGFSPRAKTHGHSARVTLRLYHLDLRGSGRPSSSSSSPSHRSLFCPRWLVRPPGVPFPRDATASHSQSASTVRPDVRGKQEVLHVSRNFPHHSPW